MCHWKGQGKTQGGCRKDSGVCPCRGTCASLRDRTGACRIAVRMYTDDMFELFGVRAEWVGGLGRI